MKHQDSLEEFMGDNLKRKRMNTSHEWMAVSQHAPEIKNDSTTKQISDMGSEI